MHRISSDSSYDGHAKRQLAIREMTESIQKLHTDVQTLGTSLFRVAAAVEDIQFHTRHTYQVLTKTNPSQRGTLPLTGAVSLATVTFANRDDEHCGETSTAPGDEIARPAFSAQRLTTPPQQHNLPSPYPQQTMSLVSAVSAREALVRDIDHMGSMEKSHAAFAVRSPSYYWSEDRHNSQGSGQDSSKGAREGGVWPTNVKLRKPLEADKNTISKEQAREKLAQTKGSKKLLKKSAQDGPGSSGGCSRLSRVQDPNSRLVAFYEILSVLAFINDLAVTPYVVAWEVEDHPKIMALNCISVLYWTLALIVKCRTGFYEGGELKLDQRAIIRHYARTSLVPDAILVAIDWFVLVWRWTEDSSSSSLRFTKLFRITKVLRLAHVWRLMEKALRTSGYFSDATLHKLAVRLGQVVLSTILFVHIMCCAWYHVGLRGDTDTGDHWLRTATNPLAGEEVPETWQFNEDVFLYMTSFHWTLATITLGAMEVSPTNSLERIFCISLLLVGMIFNATIVSLISSQTMTYVQMQRDKNATMHTLTRFLDQNMVDAKLQTRVRRQVLDRLSASSFHISEDNVPALAMLSTDLRKQLLNRTRAKYLLTHALFRTWAGADSAAFHAMCDEESGPLKFRTFKTQDYVFLPGMEADGAMLVLQGKLRYMLDISGTDVEPEFAVHGAWLAEAALWAHWVHVGRLESEGPSQLLLVEVNSFLAIVQRFELAGYLSRGYGRAFHSRIISAGPPFSKYPTDLEVPNTDPSDLLTQDVGLDLLNRERVNKDSKLAEISESAFKELVEEVTAEKCSIVQGSDGELERCVALVAVKITREDEIRIFVEVGTWDPDTDVVKPMCALPAKKRGRGELPNSAFDNILSSHLKVMREHLTVVPGMTMTEIEVKDSPQFALKTKYVRTVLQVEVDSEFDFQSLPVVSHPFRSMYREGAGMIKRRTSMGSSSSHSHNEELSLQDVYILPGDGNKRRLYAWLMPRTIERLRAEGSGRSELEKWLTSIEFPALRPGATANCTDWHPDASRDMDDSRTATFEVVEDDEEDPGVEDIDLI